MRINLTAIRFFIIVFLSLFIRVEMSAQFRQVGTWRYYVNHRYYYDLETIDKDIYVNAKRVLFEVQPSPLENTAHERTNGLADYSISTIAYDDSSKNLLVAYENTMVDIINLKDGTKKIKTNFDIYNKLVVADKSIDRIKFYKKKAYLCSRMGIIVLNTDRNEIENTFIIGDNGNYLGVKTLEIINNQILAATEKGVKIGVINPAINLQNFSNWSAPIPDLNDTFFRSTAIGNTSYWMSKNRLFSYDGNFSTLWIDRDTLRTLINMRKIGNTIYIIYDSVNTSKTYFCTKLASIENGRWSILSEFKDERLYDIAISEGKKYFTGYAFYQEEGGDKVKQLSLSGQPFDFPFRMQLTPSNKIFVSMGVMQRNLDAGMTKEGHFVLDGKYWYQHGIWGDSLMDCSNEISSIEYNGGKYRAFVRGGIVFEKSGSPLIRYRAHNSKLEASDNTYWISDMVFNPIDSSIWIANKSSKQPLKCLTRSGQWYSFDLSSVMNSTEIYRIIIDQVGNKWLLTRGDGIILFQENDINNNADNVIRKIEEIKKGSCNLNIKAPLSATIDRDGNLWVGADKGVGMITRCTYDASEDCEMYVPTQKIENPNDTTTYYECVFLNTAITSLAVDPGNRLWLGTPDGVFYNDEYLNSEFIRLNKLNSPFSAKSVCDIIVHPVTGEVLISTEVGLLSYMGQSSEAAFNENLSPFRVIPNPVPRDYEGLVTIDGFQENAYFKITDVVGNLVYQGQSNGSRITWDTRSLTGVKVPTGVYYIFSSKAQMKGSPRVGAMTVIR